MFINGEYTDESETPFHIVAYEAGSYAVMFACMEMVADMGGFTWFAILQKQNPLPLDTVEEVYEAVKAVIPGYVPLGWPMNHMDTQGDSCNYSWGLWDVNA